ncbi:hypothetical protein NLJ89_g10557 [Agrocybe chaxingu]|uniref:Uncharacterized protein n=1 Tax=Agrocybe chaxingu TaxID=84603 RepID=A0A9W8MSI1_9AGAR|nr:hypothetical protein NLJ89_g10557 [Agrocybe chaxingu]
MKIRRCVISSEGASRTLRFLIDVLLCIQALISLGLGLTYLATSVTVLNKTMLMSHLRVTMSRCNFIMMTLIVLRLSYHRGSIQQALGRAVRKGHRDMIDQIFHPSFLPDRHYVLVYFFPSFPLFAFFAFASPVFRLFEFAQSVLKCCSNNSLRDVTNFSPHKHPYGAHENVPS